MSQGQPTSCRSQLINSDWAASTARLWLQCRKLTPTVILKGTALGLLEAVLSEEFFSGVEQMLAWKIAF